MTFEHPHVNAAFEYLIRRIRHGRERSRPVPKVESNGYSIWITPRASNGWRGCSATITSRTSPTWVAKRERVIVGVAYWFPHQGIVSTALLLDIENVNNHDFTPSRPDERRYALHALVSF